MSIKRIIYLHGLESQQGGPKVDFLSDKGYVFAPEMDYKNNPDLFKDVLEEVKELGTPDLIIGSSMGGYFAYKLASYFEGVEVLLFNPALNSVSRSIEIKNIVKGPYEVGGTIYFGLKDKVVESDDTHEYLKENEEEVNFWFEWGENIGHQVPLYIFRDIYNKYLKTHFIDEKF